MTNYHKVMLCNQFVSYDLASANETVITGPYVSTEEIVFGTNAIMCSS